MMSPNILCALKASTTRLFCRWRPQYSWRRSEHQWRKGVNIRGWSSAAPTKSMPTFSPGIVRPLTTSTEMKCCSKLGSWGSTSHWTNPSVRFNRMIVRIQTFRTSLGEELTAIQSINDFWIFYWLLPVCFADNSMTGTTTSTLFIKQPLLSTQYSQNQRKRS